MPYITRLCDCCHFIKKPFRDWASPLRIGVKSTSESNISSGMSLSGGDLEIESSYASTSSCILEDESTYEERPPSTEREQEGLENSGEEYEEDEDDYSESVEDEPRPVLTSNQDAVLEEKTAPVEEKSSAAQEKYLQLLLSGRLASKKKAGKCRQM